MNVSYDRILKVNPKSLHRAAISPIRYTLRQRKGRLKGKNNGKFLPRTDFSSRCT